MGLCMHSVMVSGAVKTESSILSQSTFSSSPTHFDSHLLHMHIQQIKMHQPTAAPPLSHPCNSGALTLWNIGVNCCVLRPWFPWATRNGFVSLRRCCQRSSQISWTDPSHQTRQDLGKPHPLGGGILLEDIAGCLVKR